MPENLENKLVIKWHNYAVPSVMIFLSFLMCGELGVIPASLFAGSGYLHNCFIIELNTTDTSESFAYRMNRITRIEHASSFAWILGCILIVALSYVKS
jgi:hypothetical protein